MKNRSLLFSDAHLKRRDDEQFALSCIIKAAIKYGVTKVIAAGDLLDRQINRSDPIAYFYKELDKLEEAGIEFWYLQGQHDSDSPPWLSGHRWAKHLHKQTIELNGCTVYGLDFQPFGKLQEELNEIPNNCDMLIAHQCWGDWMGDIAVPQGEFKQIPEHIELLYTGDLHQWRLEEANEKKLLVCSTGATTKQKIDEPDEHFYALFSKQNFARRILPSRVFIDWPLIVTQEDLTSFMDKIENELLIAYQKAEQLELPEYMSKPLMRVSYSHRIPETVRRINKVVGDRVLLHWKEVAPASITNSKQKEFVKSDNAITPLNMLPNSVNEKDNPEVFELCSRLLQANNFKEEFQKWWTEQLGDTT